MNKTWQIPRRTFLKGLGTVIALPMLEAMLPPAKLFAGRDEFFTTDLTDSTDQTRKIVILKKALVSTGGNRGN